MREISSAKGKFLARIVDKLFDDEITPNSFDDNAAASVWWSKSAILINMVKLCGSPARWCPWPTKLTERLCIARGAATESSAMPDTRLEILITILGFRKAA